MVKTVTLSLATKGHGEVKDITPAVAEGLAGSDLFHGIVTVFVPGSTAGVTTIEYEPGAVRDLQDAVERLYPEGIPYGHDERWGDGNGFAHIRAAMMGPSLTVPFRDRKLLLGTWQQIVLVDFDNRPRQRKVVLQILGE
jgi:secondary thiamine-phosphate synthase enzyme